jgi:hypothetical protein
VSDREARILEHEKRIAEAVDPARHGKGEEWAAAFAVDPENARAEMALAKAAAAAMNLDQAREIARRTNVCACGSPIPSLRRTRCTACSLRGFSEPEEKRIARGMQDVLAVRAAWKAFRDGGGYMNGIGAGVLRAALERLTS